LVLRLSVSRFDERVGLKRLVKAEMNVAVGEVGLAYRGDYSDDNGVRTDHYTHMHTLWVTSGQEADVMLEYGLVAPLEGGFKALANKLM
jgi:hypothetical protein